MGGFMSFQVSELTALDWGNLPLYSKASTHGYSRSIKLDWCSTSISSIGSAGEAYGAWVGDGPLLPWPCASWSESERAPGTLIPRAAVEVEIARSTAATLTAIAYAGALPTADEDAAEEEILDPTPPDVSLDLLIKYRSGDIKQNLVLKVQDTGGQPIFLSILELLTTPEGTIYSSYSRCPSCSRPLRTRSRQLSDSSSRSSSLQPERRSSWWAHARTT